MVNWLRVSKSPFVWSHPHLSDQSFTGPCKPRYPSKISSCYILQNSCRLSVPFQTSTSDPSCLFRTCGYRDRCLSWTWIGLRVCTILYLIVSYVIQYLYISSCVIERRFEIPFWSSHISNSPQVPFLFERVLPPLQFPCRNVFTLWVFSSRSQQSLNIR